MEALYNKVPKTKLCWILIFFIPTPFISTEYLDFWKALSFWPQYYQNSKFVHPSFNFFTIFYYLFSNCKFSNVNFQFFFKFVLYSVDFLLSSSNIYAYKFLSVFYDYIYTFLGFAICFCYFYKTILPFFITFLMKACSCSLYSFYT